jgi:hypothetical protein
VPIPVKLFPLQLLFATISVLFSFHFSSAEFQFMAEGGALWQNRNDVQITPQTGTRVEFDELDKGPFVHYRFELSYKWNKKHGVRGVYAPLEIGLMGRFPNAINYNGEIYNPNQDVEIDYKFNSYRATYFYSLWDSGDHWLDLGVTLKARDAEIRFTQGATTSSYDNVGFVPLFYLNYLYKVSANWSFLLNTDFAGSSQGRALDLALKLRRKLGSNSEMGLGVRTLEGGADNDKVYSFSWINYALVDWVVRF